MLNWPQPSWRGSVSDERGRDDCSALHSGDSNPECADGENAGNSRDPERVALSYSPESEWRNRTEFLRGSQEIEAFLKRKWKNELDYRLLPIPATYVIDTNGIITLAFVDVDYHNRLPAEILAALSLSKEHTGAHHANPSR
jgi:Protein of unknown function (DUF1348)